MRLVDAMSQDIVIRRRGGREQIFNIHNQDNRWEAFAVLLREHNA
jgi:hypothetical protein